MKEEFYLIDPSGDKIGPVDIVTLTRWARDGKLLPDNTVSDLEGNVCKARDIITFVKVTPKIKSDPPLNRKVFFVVMFIMAFICAVCVVGYLGIRVNYDKLQKDHIILKHKYESSLMAIEELEKENGNLTKNTTEFIQRMVNNYNLLESERDELKDKLNSLNQENKTLKELKEALNIDEPEPVKEETKKAIEFKGVPLPEDL